MSKKKRKVPIYDVYVHAEKGSDEKGDGTMEKPFATVQRALNEHRIIDGELAVVVLDR